MDNSARRYNDSLNRTGRRISTARNTTAWKKRKTAKEDNEAGNGDGENSQLCETNDIDISDITLC